MIGDLLMAAFCAWAGGGYVGYRHARVLGVPKVHALVEAAQWPWRRL